MSRSYRFSRWLIGRLVSFIRLEVKGRENIPKEGALIVVCNHLSLADPPLLAHVIDRRTVFLAKEELFRYGPLAYLVRGFGTIPVKKGRINLDAFRMAEAVLTEGLALAIFPEGMRSKSDGLRKAFSGVALVARRSGAPVLPVGISGSERIKGLGWLVSRPVVNVSVGKVFYPASTPVKPDRNTFEEATDDIMGHIAALLPATYRGVYAERVKDDT
ncbi:MAG: lysophospholipid acyltransferase family protein [Chloroflexota bacterium]